MNRRRTPARRRRRGRCCEGAIGVVSSRQSRGSSRGCLEQELHFPMMQAAPVIPVLTGSSIAARRAGPFEVSLVEHRGDVALARHRHAEAVIGLLLRVTYDEWMDG